MTMLLVSDGEGIEELGTNSGYCALIDWTDEQDKEQFPLLSHLIEYGWIDDLPGLTAELDEAEADGDIAKALDKIREAVKSAAGDTLQITNGMIDDDGSDEEGEDSDE